MLWHLEVMSEPTRNIAHLLGIEVNAVRDLLIQAREGLRAAYEQQIVWASEPENSDLDDSADDGMSPTSKEPLPTS